MFPGQPRRRPALKRPEARLIVAISNQAQVDYRRKWHVLAAVSMGIFLSTIDASIVNIALPTLVRALDSDFATVQWVVLAYLLGITTLMLSVGRLADMLGKKPIYAAGFVIFTLGSLLCGLSPTVYWLIGFRVLQAVGATMILALGLAIVTEAFPAGERGRALGITGSFISVGIVIGPTLGGIILQALTWHWIFLVNLPVGVLGIWLVLRYVPDLRPAGEQQFDFGGALTLFVALLALLLALTLGQNAGFSDGRVLALLVIALLAAALFIFIEQRATQPMIDLRLFASPLLSIGLITGFLSFVAIAGTTLLLPFYLEELLGYDTRTVGVLLAIVPVALGIVAPISGILSDRFGTRPIAVTGLAVLVLGYALMSRLDAQTSALAFTLLFLPIGLGMGFFQSPNNSAIMGSAPRERLGVASGLLSISRSLGQTVGIAVLGAVWAARVFHHAGEILPAGATTAPIPAQISALQETFLVIAGLVGLALLLAIWGLIQARREGKTGG